MTDARARRPASGKQRARDDAALMELINAIAARDRRRASRILASAPALSRAVVTTGATRANGTSWFLEAIAHHVYAGDTALHIAAAAYQTASAAELIEAGALLGARNRRGAEPLHYAADGSPGSAGWDPGAQQAMVELLIGAGANPNAVDRSGVAPLHRAVRTRSAAAVRALLANGAETRLKNASGSTPLHLAVQNTGRGSSGSTEAREQQAEIIRLLQAHGARASDTNASGSTVLASVSAAWIRELLNAA